MYSGYSRWSFMTKKSTNVLLHLPLHTELPTDPNSSTKHFDRHMPAPDWDVQTVARTEPIPSLPLTEHKGDESIRDFNTRHVLQSKMEKEKNRLTHKELFKPKTNYAMTTEEQDAAIRVAFYNDDTMPKERFKNSNR